MLCDLRVTTWNFSSPNATCVCVLSFDEAGTLHSRPGQDRAAAQASEGRMHCGLMSRAVGNATERATERTAK